MTKHRAPIFLLLLAVTIFGIYGRTLTYELVWDDADFLRQDSPFFTEHKLGESFRLGYFVEPGDRTTRFYYYRPLVVASFQLERALWGLRPWSMRLVNLALFILALAVLYRLMRNLFGASHFAEIATLLFALNPLNADSLVWIVGRCDLFVLLWGSLALLALSRHADQPKAGRWIAAVVFFALGILSKESFVFFLPALVAFELVRRGRLTPGYHLSNLGVTAAFFAVKNGLLGIGNPPLEFLPGLWKNVLKLIAGAGYYARSIVFPVVHDRFLPDSELSKPVYLVFGIGLAVAFLALIYASFRSKGFAVPTALLAGFVGGSLGLAFTRFVSYNLYARYMMIPALAATWLLVLALCRVKEWVRNVIAFAVLLAFIPAVVVRASDYRTNLGFFQSAERAFPEEGYLSYQVAAAFHGREDALNTELALQRAMRRPLGVRVAVSARLLQAEIEFRRAEYPKARRWLGSFAEFPAEVFTPFLRYQEAEQKGLLALAEGDAETAERLFRSNIEAVPKRPDAYQELARLFLGREDWDRAADVERTMRDRFGTAVTLDTAKLRGEFEEMSAADKADFHFRQRNYARAIEILNGIPGRTVEQDIGLVRLYLRAGRETEAKDAAARLTQEGAGGVKAWNALGMLYLREFLRVEDALAGFKESLRLDRNQPDVAGLFLQLTGYLQMAQPLAPPIR